MVQIVRPSTDQELNQVRDLMRAFIQWHFVRHAEDIELVNSYFDKTAFEEELAGLPGKYAPPEGSLLLALVDSMPAGCVALRQIDENTCEMKRMFVYEQFHGHGVGKALAERIIEDGKALGYRKMVLDTGARQREAKGLYHGMGFKDIEPYYSLPPELAQWLTFMELELTRIS